MYSFDYFRKKFSKIRGEEKETVGEVRFVPPVFDFKESIQRDTERNLASLQRALDEAKRFDDAFYLEFNRVNGSDNIEITYANHNEQNMITLRAVDIFRIEHNYKKYEPKYRYGPYVKVLRHVDNNGIYIGSYRQEDYVEGQTYAPSLHLNDNDGCINLTISYIGGKSQTPNYLHIKVPKYLVQDIQSELSLKCSQPGRVFFTVDGANYA